jgi:very-short-patch-repair endonuclease
MKRNNIIPYRQDLRQKARELRNNSTLSEVLLWKELKDRQLLDYQFHRQVPLLNYMVDFYCHELRLAIEIDGDSHDHKITYDSRRQKELETYKVHFVRFDDLDVKKNIGFVLNEILFHIQEIASRK